MSCTKHSPFGRHKNSLGESYVRSDNWWKDPEEKPRAYSSLFLKSGSYRTKSFVGKVKFWSVVHLQSDPQDLTETDFSKLAAQWRRDTHFHSSLSKKFTHPAYVTIMASGTSALPFIFRELEKAPDHWFYALRYIVRRDVASGVTTFDEAREAWLNWAKENSYL
jgi:hypothetical protein